MTLQIELNGVNKFYGSPRTQGHRSRIEEGTFVALVRAFRLRQVHAPAGHWPGSRRFRPVR